MKLISSRDNPQVKQLKLLAGNASAKKRDGKTLLEGVHLCQSYLQHGWPLLCAISETALHNTEVMQLVATCEAQNLPCLQLPHSLFAEISDVENGPAIVFVIALKSAPPPAQLTQSAVLLDQVQDPGNLGSILRSAAAAGITQIYCNTGCVQAWSPKVLRAGMGAHFLLDIYEHCDLQQVMQTAKVPVLATSSHSSQLVYDVNLRQAVAWLFGNEGQGVSDELMKQAQHLLALPHVGAMESLNVAACAAICFFEQLRQQRAAGLILPGK